MAKIDKTKLPKKLTDKWTFEPVSDRGIVKKETFFREVKENPKDKIQVEIGDSKQTDFKPQAKIMRWDNEVNFSMRAEEDPTATVEAEGEKLKYKTKDYEFHIYDAPQVDEDGGLEVEWVLHKKPSTNVLKATIQSKELDFFYQPPLTEEVDGKEIVTATETQGFDKDGNVVIERPDEVVGSYAVYHKTKGGLNSVFGKEYKSGKAFHIYRPFAYDKNGMGVWCNLNIDEQNGLLTVTVPQNFLDTAVYPVVVDPTFGNTGTGGSNNFQFTSTATRAQYYLMAPEPGTLNSISAHVNLSGSGSRTGKMALYSATSSTDINSLLDDTNEVTIDSTTYSWKTGTANTGYSLVASTGYFLVIGGSSGSAPTPQIKTDSVAPAIFTFPWTYPNFPSGPVTGESSVANRKASIYATYTPTTNTVIANALTTSGSGTDATSYTTASITPGSDALVLAWVYSIATSPNAPTLSGNGLTWTQVATILDSASSRRLTLFRATGSTPSTGTITIDFAGQTQTGCTWSVIEYYGCDVGGTNGANAIVQSVTGESPSNATTQSLTLSAFGNVNNATVAGWGVPRNTADYPRAGPGFTRTGQRNQGTPNMSMATEFKAYPDTSPDITYDTSITGIGIAVELKVAIPDSSPDYAQHSVSTYANTGTSDTVTAPPDIADGDVLLMAVGLFTDTGGTLSAEKTITWPSGFTQLESIYNNSVAGNEVQLAVAYKIASSEAGDYTASWTGNVGNISMVALYKNTHSSSPIDDSDIAESSGNATSIAVPALTANVADTLYVAMTLNWVGGTWTPASGLTGRQTSGALGLFDENISSTGSTGTNTPTYSDSGVSIGAGILIKPPSAGPTEKSVSDSGSGAEAIDILSLLSLSDSGSGSEVLSLLVTLSLSDSGLGSDAVASLVDIALSDSALSSEATSLLVTILLSETPAASEALSILVTLLLAETGSGSNTVFASPSVVVADSGSIASEIIDILALVSLSDSTTASEALTVLVAFALSESASSSDAVSALVAISTLDSGAGAEVVSLLNQVTLSENPNAVETLQILSSFAVSDTAIGSEAVAVIGSIAIADSGILASEAISLLVMVALSEAPIATETVHLLAQIALSDSGNAQEAVFAGLASGLFTRRSDLANRSSSLYNRAAQLATSRL